MISQLIPQERRAAVVKALDEAFGVTTLEDIRVMTKGRTSALVFRIVVRDVPFLLRIITRAGENPMRHFTCMRAAAEAGLAPRVRYASVEERISITDFVAEMPFPATQALVRMAALLRRLHAIAPFPRAPNHLNTTCMFLLNKGTALDEFISKFRAANILSEGESKEFFARYAQVAAVYPLHEPDMVSSHNDLFKPDNILFDGRRVWLVDWEAAFLNDRYADLAVVANMIVTNEGEAREYLQEYLGQPPNEYQLARLFLMQQLAHIFYAMAFLFLGSSGRPVSESGEAPELREFQRRFWAGEVRLEDLQTKAIYGKVHQEWLLQNTRGPRFAEALRIVSDRHAARDVSGLRPSMRVL